MKVPRRCWTGFRPRLGIISKERAIDLIINSKKFWYITEDDRALRERDNDNINHPPRWTQRGPDLAHLTAFADQKAGRVQEQAKIQPSG